MNSKSGNSHKLSKKIFIGGIAGVTGFTITYPLDHLRTILQTSNYSYKHILQNFKPFKGYGVGISYIFPEKALKLGISDYLVSHKINPLIAGTITGFTHSFITSPMELIKIRVQREIHHDFRSALKNCSNIWRGLPLTMARDIPFGTLFFSIYENTKQYNSFGAGVLSGMVATFLVTPIDVIKTQYQSKNNGCLRQLVKDTYKTYGFKGMFRGVLPRSFSIAFMYGFTTMIFEFIKQFH